jgi:hypothetical protein
VTRSPVDRDPLRRGPGHRRAAGGRAVDGRRGGVQCGRARRLPRPAADAGPAGRLADAQPGRLRAAARRPRRDPATGAPHGVLPAATTTPSSTRSSAPPARAGPAADDPAVFVTRAADPAVRPDGARPGSCWSTRPARHGPVGGRLAPARPRRRLRGHILNVLARAAWTCATGCCSPRPAPRPTWPTRRPRRAARSTAPRAACCARPTAARSPNLVLPGRRLGPPGRRPADGHPLGARSSPTRSARPAVTVNANVVLLGNVTVACTPNDPRPVGETLTVS